jgi:hypothetical protein
LSTRLSVTVVLEGGEPPPPGTTLRVEVRDVAYADAPAEVLGAAATEVAGAVAGASAEARPVLGAVTCEVERAPEMGVVWCHIDVDGDGRVSAGDYITTQSWPVPPGGAGEMTVTVRRI